MGSTFSGLELSRRALASQQAALNTTGHNISNANTQGYTRQIANLTATTPDVISISGRNLSVGTGVTLATITRARDAFVDRQFRTETSKQQYWVAKQDNLSQVEEVLNEPSDNSLSNDMNQFWTAWSDLSKDPENAGARSVVSQRAQALTDSFHNINQQVNDMKDNMDESIKVQVSQINNYGLQIKDLNDQIKRAEVAGDNSNDLRDQRDSLVDDLSKIVNVRVVETKDPQFTDRDVNNYKVIIGNENSKSQTVLVDNSAPNSLKVTSTTDTDGLTQVSVAWSDGSALDLGTNLGTLYGDLQTRNTDLPNFGKQIDALAQGIADGVNALHQTGQGLTAEPGAIGINFFTGIDTDEVIGGSGSIARTANPPDLPKVTAASINLNSEIVKNVDRIATGTIPLDNTDPLVPVHAKNPDGSMIVTAGDGTIAQGISSLSSGWNALTTQIKAGIFGKAGQTPVPAGSLSDLYASNVAELGVAVQQATRMKAGEDVLVTNVTNQRESMSGVSLDEEITNLIKFQKSYSAAARMVTMMDDMLSTILNMGITK